jgi:NTP pyrophosphatase (non-canonical NTP hydrolase)
MTPNEYQRLAARTLLDKPEVMPTPEEMMIVWNAIGLAGEVGEVCEIIKKVIFHRHAFTDEVRNKLIKELGDVSWYHAGILTKIKALLEDCMADNISKLESRYPNGFTSSDSINRKEIPKPPSEFPKNREIREGD